MRSGSYRRADASAARPIARRRRGCSISRVSAPASASASPFGTRNPSTPSCTISAGPSGQSVLTTGTPQRMASTSVIPNDSASEALATTSARANSASIGERVPIRRTRPVSPCAAIRSRSRSFSGPPP